jgi:drug/metabolite transporter (DMT)-like permease
MMFNHGRRARVDGVTEVALALLASVCFAASHVVSRRGLEGTSVSAAYLVIVGCAGVVVMVPVLLDPPESVSSRAVVFFALSGLFAPAISRAAALGGVRALGPSISVPIQQGLRPLIVVPAAVIVLNETVGWTRALGLAAIVAGGWILSREPERADELPAEALVAPGPATGGPGTAVQRRSRATTWGFRRGIAFPVAAAVGYATADLLVKVGLGGRSDPVYAAPVSIGVGFCVWALAHVSGRVRRRFSLGRDWGWLVLAGAFMGAAIMLLFRALARGEVTLVAPVIATQPLFVLLLSAIVLRTLERRDRTTIVAASVVVVGTVLVSL